jgi:predicted nucleic acid-binding protein
MTKKVIDTNIYIDLFADADLYTEIFISEGPIHLSSIVFMELLAGAHTKNEKREIQNFINLFRKLGRILISTVKDYEQAGDSAGIQIRERRC